MTDHNVIHDRMYGSQGSCPVCGSDCLDYGIVQDCDIGICYPWVCEECGSTGKECYSIDFDSHQEVITKTDANDSRKELTGNSMYCAQIKDTLSSAAVEESGSQGLKIYPLNPYASLRLRKRLGNILRPIGSSFQNVRLKSSAYRMKVNLHESNQNSLGC